MKQRLFSATQLLGRGRLDEAAGGAEDSSAHPAHGYSCHWQHGQDTIAQASVPFINQETTP